MEVEATPAEGDLENTVEVGDATVAAHEETAPDGRVDPA